jgi:hypothetical protein
MAYGLSTRAFTEDASSEHAADGGSSRSPIRSWRVLSEACRLEIVEQALLAANDRLGGYPIAL